MSTILWLEALERLASETSDPVMTTPSRDGRVAIFLPVRAPRRDLVGSP